MANDINFFFVSMAADLPSLRQEVLATLAIDYTDYCITEVAVDVEFRLSNISVNKSSGSNCLPDWLLKDMAPFI